MSKIYSPASESLCLQVASAITKYCPDLTQSGVRIDCLTIADSDPDSDEPALKLHGYPCAAVVRIQSAKERARGLGDAEIVFDEKTFIGLPVETQNALIHHELHHLEIQRTPKGKMLLDDYHRPKLKMRLHDRQFGWFDEVARVHGIASMEVRQASTLVLSGKQLYFSFALSGSFVPETRTELVA